MTSSHLATSAPDPIVITGAGIACPWGVGPADQVLARKPGPDADRSDDGAWRLSDQLLAPDARRVARFGGDRTALLCARAIQHTLAHAAFELAPDRSVRVGLVLGSVTAALPDMMHFAAQVREKTPRFVSPIHFPQTVGNYAAGALARHFSINGPNLTFAQGAHAGLVAPAEGARLLHAGWADAVLAGGGDALSANILSPMIESGAFRPDGPFASQPAEGACFVLLELESRARSRGAPILARMYAGGLSEDISIVSADLTGQADSDRTELDQLRKETQRPQDWRAVLSARHQTGNCLAAASAAQLALAVLAVAGYAVPVWSAGQTQALARPDFPESAPLNAEAILVASAPDSAAHRAVFRITRA